MKFGVNYIGSPQRPRLFGKAMNRIRQGLLKDLLSQLEELDIPGEHRFECMTLIICQEHSLEHWQEDHDDDHLLVGVGVAPGLTYKKPDDHKFAIFVIERIRFLLQHKGYLTPELASLLRDHIDRIRSSAQPES